MSDGRGGTGFGRPFVDRWEAGRRLAEEVAPKVDPARTVILGLPRGGVPVAHEIAARVGAPLDVLMVRKLGVPWQPELAFGAVASGGVIVYDDDVVAMADLSEAEMEEVAARERAELARRERLYRGGRAPLDVKGRTAVVVDDGIATGSTVRAALKALKELGAERRIVATPVAPPETVELLLREADDVICLLTPPDLMAIGFWYEDFLPVEDEEVLRLLAEGSRPRGEDARHARPRG